MRSIGIRTHDAIVPPHGDRPDGWYPTKLVTVIVISLNLPDSLYP